MTPSDLAAIDALEGDAKRIFGQFPRISARITWLCELVKRLDAPESVKDDRDAVLVAQAERIRTLEQRLQLTPDRVLAAEREDLRKRHEKAVEKATKKRAAQADRANATSHTPSAKLLRKRKSKTTLAT